MPGLAMPTLAEFSYQYPDNKWKLSETYLETSEGAAAGGGRTHFELLQLSAFVQVLNLKTM